MSASADKPSTKPERRTFPKGTTIFKEGEPGAEAYILESGKVRIFKMVAGRRIAIGYVRPWTIFGELALLDDGVRMASAYAEEDTTCITVHKASLTDMLDQAPKGLTTIIHSLVQTMRTMGDDLADTKSALLDATR